LHEEVSLREREKLQVKRMETGPKNRERYESKDSLLRRAVVSA